MPPKAKYTKEQIIFAAMNVVEREGAQALTARALGIELGSSARPIFTLFPGMDEVKNDVVLSSKALYAEYVKDGLKETPAFKGVGKAYIRFASEHPRLFTMLFMSGERGSTDIGSALGAIDDCAEVILGSVTDGYGLDRNAAQKLYLNMWIYTHGIAALIATGVCKFTAEEISDMLTEVFVGMLKELKSRGEL